MDFEADITASLQVLRTGGLILYPTDTIWGIGCDATNPAAVEKVFALKKRNESKSLVILLAEARDLVKYTSQPDPAIADIIDSFDRPTTIIYEGALGMAPNVIAADGSVAIRIVRDTFCRHLIKRLRAPLVSTSANISGDPSPANFNGISTEIKTGVEYIVQHRQNDIRPAVASRIVRIRRDGSLEILRD